MENAPLPTMPLILLVQKSIVHTVFLCKYLGEASIRKYKCARVLVMAIAPITHYAINITLTKVNRALAHDELVQERGGLDAHVICRV